MKSEIKKKLCSVILCTLTAVMLLTACGGSSQVQETIPETVDSTERALENYEAAKDNLDNIYYNTLEELNSEDGLLGSDMPLSQRIYIWFYNTYRTIKDAAWMIIAVSIFLGVLIVAVSRKDKRIQRFAIVFLIILIPLATLLLVFAFGVSPLFKYK